MCYDRIGGGLVKSLSFLFVCLCIGLSARADSGLSSRVVLNLSGASGVTAQVEDPLAASGETVTLTLLGLSEGQHVRVLAGLMPDAADYPVSPVEGKTDQFTFVMPDNPPIYINVYVEGSEEDPVVVPIEPEEPVYPDEPDDPDTPIDPDDPDQPTANVAVEEERTALSVLPVPGGLSVEAEVPSTVEVYSLWGRRLAVSGPARSHRLSVPAGIWLVRVGEETVKVYVRQ